MAKQKREIVAVFSAQNKAKGVMAGFRRGLDNTGQAMKRMAKVGAVMTVAAAAGLAYMVKRQMETIDVIAKLSDRLGIATEDLVGLQHAASISGVSTEALNKSLEMFMRRLGEMTIGSGEAKRGLDMLGLTTADLIRLSPAEAMGIAADRINRLETQAEKAAAAYFLFGRAGAQLVNMFAVGSEGLREFQREAEKLGLTFSRFDAAQIEAANDALTRARATMTGLFRTATIELAPYIEVLADKFVDVATAGEGLGANVVNVFENMSLAALKFGETMSGLPGYWKALEAAGHEYLVLHYQIGDAITNLDVLFKKLKVPKFEKTFKELIEEHEQKAEKLLEAGGADLAKAMQKRSAVEKFYDDLRKKAAGRREAVAGISPAKEVSLLPPVPELDRERKSAIEGIKKYTAALEKEIEIAKRVAQGHLYAAQMIGLENELKKAGIEDTASATATIEAYIKRLEVLQKLKDEMAAKKQQEAAAKDVERILDGMQRELDMVGQVSDTWERSREFADLHAKAIKTAAGNMEKYNSIMAKGMDIFEKYKLAERWAEMSRSMESSFSSAMERMIFEGQKFGDAMKMVFREIMMEAVRIQFIRPAAQALADGMAAFGVALFGGVGMATVGTVTPQAGATMARYQGGGIIRETGPAWMHKGEKITPAGGGNGNGGGKLEVNVTYKGDEKPEVTEADFDFRQQVLNITMEAAGTDGAYRRAHRLK